MKINFRTPVSWRSFWLSEYLRYRFDFYNSSQLISLFRIGLFRLKSIENFDFCSRRSSTTFRYKITIFTRAGPHNPVTGENGYVKSYANELIFIWTIKSCRHCPVRNVPSSLDRNHTCCECRIRFFHHCFCGQWAQNRLLTHPAKR